jgi:phosphopantetheinyl transferase
MPLYKQWTENPDITIAIWHITEDEEFFNHTAGLYSDKRLPKRRLEHLASRYLLQLLAPDLSLHHITISEAGKPFHPGHPLHFSISHSFPFAAVAVSKHIAGIDIECYRDKIIRLRDKFLSPAEQSIIATNIQELTLAWSAKEAAFKWYEKGGIDFIAHMPITQFNCNNNQAQIVIDFNKDIPTTLDLQGGLEPEFSWAVARSLKKLPL